MTLNLINLTILFVLSIYQKLKNQKHQDLVSSKCLSFSLYLMCYAVERNIGYLLFLSMKIYNWIICSFVGLGGSALEADGSGSSQLRALQQYFILQPINSSNVSIHFVSWVSDEFSGCLLQNLYLYHCLGDEYIHISILQKKKGPPLSINIY